MRLLQVITDDDRRGAQVFAHDLGARLEDEGIEVRTLALAAGAVGGLEVEVIGRRPWLRNLGALRQAIRQADVVLAHGGATLPATALAGMGTGRPFIYRQVSDPVHWTRTIARRVRTTGWYRRVTRVVALSPAVADLLGSRFHVDRSRITVIPNAVDERRWPPASDEERSAARRKLGLPPRPAAVVATVGALTPEKGVVDLVETSEGAWHLLVVGDGPERPALEAAAGHRGLAATFTGVLDEPWPAFAAADVVALPSRSDMHPAVVLESALVGTPVLATDVGAVRDLVLDGVTGRVVAPRDGEVLRRALTDLLADHDLRATLAATARAHALDRHSLTALVPRWLELLREVSNQR